MGSSSFQLFPSRLPILSDPPRRLPVVHWHLPAFAPIQSDRNISLKLLLLLFPAIVPMPMPFLPSLWPLLLLLLGHSLAKYPNEIIDTPIVSCEPDSIAIKIRTSSANPSHIYAEDFHDTPKCMVRNQNKVTFGHGECGMTMEHLDNPAGTMYRICLSVQIHPLFVTDSDRSYCAQCVYMEANLVDDLERNIAISEMTPNELDPQFDEASNPQCSYSIRKGTVDGPEVHAAVVGETVFHVWQCNNENVGILVQNCHVEDLQGDKILIIDQNGCGVDQYLFRTPQYSNDLHTAFLQSSVFKFVDKSMTRFRCQLRLCVKNRGQGCARVTPPSSCPNIDESDPMPMGPSSSSSASGSHSAAVVGGGSPPSLSPTAELLRRQISPPSGRVEPPSSNGLAPPPGVSLISGGTDPKGNTPKPSNGLEPIGPPSIRPFGPGRAAAAPQIVSGKTEQLFSGGGYPYYRERRSALQMLYGQGHRHQQRSMELHRMRRQAVGGRSSRNRQEGVQELDVVGLIRVLDNPDDIQYYADQNRTPASPPTPPAIPAQPLKTLQAIQSSRPRLQLLPRPPPVQLQPAVPLQPLPPVAVVETAAESAVPIEGEGEEEKQTCLPTGTFWTMLLALAGLLCLQLSFVALILVDRLLLDGKYLSKKVQKVLASY